MPIKDIAKQVIDALPDGATMDDIIHALYVKAKFEHGEQEIRTGKGSRILRMNKTRMTYFEKDDILHLVISDEPEAGSVEINPNITAELNAKGELIGIEIMSASTFIRDSMLDSVQARVLDLAEAKTN